MHTARYISLEKVVKDYMAEANYAGTAFLRLYQIAVRGYEELWQDVAGKAKTRRLTVLPNNTVELPSDYIKWIKVGVVNAEGEVATLRHNVNLTGYAATDPNRMSAIDEVKFKDVIDTFDETTAYRNYFDDETNDTFNLFGLPAGRQNLGEFRVIEDDGVIIFNGNFDASEIILEYLALPFEANKPIMMPIQIKEAMIAFIAWIEIRSMATSRRINMTEKAMRKREYYNQKRLARMRIKAIRKGEINDTIRLNNNLVLKP